MHLKLCMQKTLSLANIVYERNLPMIHVYKPDLVFWTEHGYNVGSEQVAKTFTRYYSFKRNDYDLKL